MQTLIYGMLGFKNVLFLNFLRKKKKKKITWSIHIPSLLHFSTIFFRIKFLVSGYSVIISFITSKNIFVLSIFIFLLTSALVVTLKSLGVLMLLVMSLLIK